VEQTHLEEGWGTTYLFDYFIKKITQKFGEEKAQQIKDYMLMALL
jgi:hypothetical protein